MQEEMAGRISRPALMEMTYGNMKLKVLFCLFLFVWGFLLCLPPSIYGNSSLQLLVLKDPFVLLSQLLPWKAVS